MFVPLLFYFIYWMISKAYLIFTKIHCYPNFIYKGYKEKLRDSSKCTYWCMTLSDLKQNALFLREKIYIKKSPFT